MHAIVMMVSYVCILYAEHAFTKGGCNMQLFARILAYILAAFLAFMGIQKFIGDVPIFQIIEANTGIAAVSPALTYITGILEILAAALLVFGHRLWGGLVALAVTAGAVVSHLTVLGISTPMAGFPDGVTADTFTCGADGVTCSPMLFMMALAFLAVSILVVLFSRIDADT